MPGRPARVGGRTGWAAQKRYVASMPYMRGIGAETPKSRCCASARPVAGAAFGMLIRGPLKLR